MKQSSLNLSLMCEMCRSQKLFIAKARISRRILFSWLHFIFIKYLRIVIPNQIIQQVSNKYQQVLNEYLVILQ